MHALYSYTCLQCLHGLPACMHCTHTRASNVCMDCQRACTVLIHVPPMFAWTASVHALYSYTCLQCLRRWSNLLYINNFYPADFHKTCMSWYVYVVVRLCGLAGIRYFPLPSFIVVQVSRSGLCVTAAVYACIRCVFDLSALLICPLVCPSGLCVTAAVYACIKCVLDLSALSAVLCCACDFAGVGTSRTTCSSF